MELTEELSFDCSAPGLTIWILPTRKDYDECTAGEGSQQLRVCQREGDEFVMYLVSDYTERTAQGNFVAVQADQTEVYMACELRLPWCVGWQGKWCESSPPPCSSVRRRDGSWGLRHRGKDGHWSESE